MNELFCHVGCRDDKIFTGDAVLTSVSCGMINVWAVDTKGVVYQRIGVKAPTSHSLNAAWLPVDMGRQSSTVFTHIATGPKDFMVGCKFLINVCTCVCIYIAFYNIMY